MQQSVPCATLSTPTTPHIGFDLPSGCHGGGLDAKSLDPCGALLDLTVARPPHCGRYLQRQQPQQQHSLLIPGAIPPALPQPETNSQPPFCLGLYQQQGLAVGGLDMTAVDAPPSTSSWSNSSPPPDWNMGPLFPMSSPSVASAATSPTWTVADTGTLQADVPFAPFFQPSCDLAPTTSNTLGLHFQEPQPSGPLSAPASTMTLPSALPSVPMGMPSSQVPTSDILAPSPAFVGQYLSPLPGASQTLGAPPPNDNLGRRMTFPLALPSYEMSPYLPIRSATTDSFLMGVRDSGEPKPAAVVRPKRKFKRSKTGCLVCRRRKVRCSQDGTPCRQCKIGKRECYYAPKPQDTEVQSPSGTTSSPVSMTFTGNHKQALVRRHSDCATLAH